MTAARRSTIRLAVLVAGGVLVAWLLVSAIAGWSLNPFATETKDRSQPVLVKSLESLSEYRAATANMQEIVDIERDVGLLPSFIAGEKALLVAAGTVEAGVDFRRAEREGLGEGQRRPARRRDRPSRRRRSRRRASTSRAAAIVDTDRGIVNRVGDAFSDDTNEERELLLLAERKIEEAAARTRICSGSPSATRGRCSPGCCAAWASSASPSASQHRPPDRWP